MRCTCCNKNLSDYESRLRHPEHGTFLDICLKCLEYIPIQPVAPKDVEQDTGYEEEQEYESFEVDEDQ